MTRTTHVDSWWWLRRCPPNEIQYLLRTCQSLLKGKYIKFVEEADGISTTQEKDFLKLMKLKYFISLAQPGELVGVLAAESVVEPSSKMTSDTFLIFSFFFIYHHVRAFLVDREMAKSSGVEYIT